MKLSFTSGQLIELLNCLNRFPGYTIHEESDYVYLVSEIQNALNHNSSTLELKSLEDVVNLYNVVLTFGGPEDAPGEPEWLTSDYSSPLNVLYRELTKNMPNEELSFDSMDLGLILYHGPQEEKV